MATSTKAKPRAKSKSKSMPEIIEIMKSDKVKIVAQVTDWQGDRIMDIRTHVVGKDGQWIPTQKGVQIPIEFGKRFVIRLVKIMKHELGEE